jgi:hypothetical protein
MGTEKEIENMRNNNSEGIHVTESGILAAAHLGGAGSVKKVILKQGQALF